MRRAVLLCCIVFALGLCPPNVAAQWPCYPGAYCPPCCPPVCCYPGAPACCPMPYAYSPGYCHAPVATPAPLVYNSAATDGPATTAMDVIAPEGVSVYVEDRHIPLQGGRLSFNVPEVRKGTQYVYNFRSETRREGRVDVERRRVVFRAGDRIRVDFTRPDPDAVTQR
jgi:uncharacterized protein (TIGR03000 family)